MKFTLNNKHLPLLTLGAGGLGLVLRFWYFSSQDAKGLLNAAHIANTLSFLVLAAALAVIALWVRKLPTGGRYQKLVPAGPIPAIGAAVGAVCILITCISDLTSGQALAGLSLILGLLAAACLVLIGLSRYQGARPSVYLYAVVIVYMIVHVLMQVRIWSKETQQAVIFFPLLASLLCMLCTYFHAQLAVRQEGFRPFVFFQQAALMLCCMSLNSPEGLFYLGMGIWLGCDLYCIRHKEEPHVPA